LRAISLTPRQRGTATASPQETTLIPKPAQRSPREQVRRQAKRDQCQARFAQVRELYAQGMSVRAIADHLTMHRATVTRYVLADRFPEYPSQRPASDILAPYREYLQRRWNEGCHNGLQLLREIPI
jgi:hypothetical protein